MNTSTPDLTKNANRYIAFSLFFTARAYYPVLAILFIDLGLTLDQFVMLNLIWAITIFLFEVPSGALADLLGRRRLLIAASVFMIIEMACLLVAPRDGGFWLLAFCILNRICSGISEACASGADEALAYDSLPAENRTQAWDKLMARAMRWRSAGFILAMIIGGILYDANLVNKILPIDWQISSEISQRLPVVLVLIQAIVCLLISLQMREPVTERAGASNTLGHILNAGKWVLKHNIALVVILTGVMLDSIVRNFATINSSYYRLIELPEWTFGFLGALFGVMGLFIPSLAKYLNNRFSLFANLIMISILTLAGLIALVPAWPYFGLIPAMLLMAIIFLLSYTISRTLHQITDSSQRATVLSVKGLIFNLGYGLFSLVFSLLLIQFSTQGEDQAMISALFWQVPAFAVIMLVLLIWSYKKLTLNEVKK